MRNEPILKSNKFYKIPRKKLNKNVYKLYKGSYQTLLTDFQ